jgi:hypothetical protein
MNRLVPIGAALAHLTPQTSDTLDWARPYSEPDNSERQR